MSDRPEPQAVHITSVAIPFGALVRLTIKMLFAFLAALILVLGPLLILVMVAGPRL